MAVSAITTSRQPTITRTRSSASRRRTFRLLEPALTTSTRMLDEAQPEFERVLIRAALKRTQGHRQEAAKLLGWGRNTLTRKLKELGMDAAE